MARGVIKPYRSYMFHEKDPVIDELRTILQDKFGEVDQHAFTTVRENGGPTSSAMRGWFVGGTRRPQSATIEAAGRAVGMKRVWVDAHVKQRRAK